MSYYLEIFMADHQGSLSKVYKYSNHFLEVYEQISKSQRRNMSLRQTPTTTGLLLAQQEAVDFQSQCV